MQIFDRTRSALDHVLDDPFVTESGARVERILDMVVEAVLGIGDRRNASLGIMGRGFRSPGLRDDSDRAVLGDSQGKMQTGHATSDDEEIDRSGDRGHSGQSCLARDGTALGEEFSGTRKSGSVGGRSLDLSGGTSPPAVYRPEGFPRNRLPRRGARWGCSRAGLAEGFPRLAAWLRFEPAGRRIRHKGLRIGCAPGLPCRVF